MVKKIPYLAKRLQISENEIKDRLAYTIEHGFVIVKQSEQISPLV